ncbi:MAG: helix-turn-helix domain-containing protein [Roseibium sp.]|uniref:helix-turn-helix domain-containing protein n=2 Tax=Roseibium sp. TaxID=1936156 RepID=UPI00329420FA
MISQASNCRPLKSSFDWRFSFSTMALRIMTQNSNYRSVLSTANSQDTVNSTNFATRPSHLPVLSAGLRKSPIRWRRKDPFQTRVSGLLIGFETTSRETMDQLDRLSIAQGQLARHCQSCRSHSRLPEFAQMFLESPLVTIPMARQNLGVTAAAVDRKIRQLGTALQRELTGRNRYRAWGIL